MINNRYSSNRKIQELIEEGDRIANSLQFIGATIEAYSTAYDLLNDQLEGIKEELNHYQSEYKYTSQQDEKHPDRRNFTNEQTSNSIGEEEGRSFNNLSPAPSPHHKLEVYGDEEVNDEKEYYEDDVSAQKQTAEPRVKQQIPPLREPVPRYDVDVKHSIQSSNKIAQMATPSSVVPKKSFIDYFRKKKQP